MPGTPYPKKPMHRIAYTKLTQEQITAKLEPVAERGPRSASPLATDFAGDVMTIVTDEGPALSYKFASNSKLSVAENGGKPINAGFGALEIDHICLFTHMVPGTQRGYTVVVDRESKSATVIELWFSGYEDNREVQRQIYFGYVNTHGGPAPKERHEFTDRLEGRGYYWRQDTGMETLEYYPSAGYSHFVELSRTGGELGFCAPSDYVKIDNDFFLYTRTECEFSGTFTAYVIDMNRSQQIGVRLGFDEADNLHYDLFRGHGEIVGQIAHFEKLDDHTGDPIPAPKGKDGKPVKGGRRVYRPLHTMEKLSKEEVAKVVKEHSAAFPPRVTTGGAAGMSANALPSSDFLVGKTFTLRYDHGLVMEYKVDTAEQLNWRTDGNAWTPARYQAYEVAPGLFLFGHLLEGAPNHDGYIIAADFHQGLVTCFNGFLNTPYFANEAGARTLFGVLEMDGVQPPMYRRHSRTTEMLGRCITYNYAPGLTSMHLYSTPNTVSWIIFTPDGHGGMEWSGPGDFVKIRDGIYFMYWLEEACNGTLGTILLNLNIMHDAGIGYHCGAHGLNMSQIGAIVRHPGKFDVERYFQIRTQGRTT